MIVILRDDRGNRSLNYKIRKFFQNETIYDGLVIVSNRARGGFEYEIDEFNKISRNRQLEDEDTCLECTKLMKDYLSKRADVMKEIADDQFRSDRREIYRFVDTLTRLIKSFERKLL